MSAIAKSSNVLRWLEQVLLERFGAAFSLRAVHDGIALSHEFFQEEIKFRSDIINSDSFIESSCARWNPFNEGWSGTFRSDIPAPGVKALPSPLIDLSNTGCLINYDILGLTYWLLSRREEVGRVEADQHDRFPASASHAFRHGYLGRPVVDEWLHILQQVMERVWPQLELKTPCFDIKVSHDVDSPSLYGFCSPGRLLRHMASSVVKRRDFVGALHGPWIRLKTGKALYRSDPANTFDWLMDVSERNGLTSAFYFICGRTDALRDADYEPEHPAIRDLIRRIHARGHEVGLHPSYKTYRDISAISREADRLRHVCAQEHVVQRQWGGRMHFLRWEHPLTMRGWVAAGMSYDSTLGYAEFPGFRCGTCFEYPAFDPVANEVLPLRIRPLIVMEASVMSSQYLGLGNGEQALAKFLELKHACQAVGGTLTLLWHNSQFSSRAERDLYVAVLET
jgi:hypothetical protein